MNLPTPPSNRAPEKQLPRYSPGWRGLNAAAIQVWLALGLVGLGSGIIWRLTGAGPAIFDLFEGLGFVYWLVPWLLVGGWEKMRDRQTMHFTKGSGIYGLAIANALKMLKYLLLISLAPLGLFTSFNMANLAAQFRTDIFDLPVGYPEFVLVTLLLSGTIVLCFSLAFLIGARRIFGPGFGVVVWGIIGTAFNSSVLTGWSFGGFSLSFGGLAEFTRSALNSGFIDAAQVGYVIDSVRLVYGVLLAILLVGISLLVVVQAPYKRLNKKPDIYLLPALVGMLVPAIHTYAHTSRWVNDQAVAYPLPWQSLFMVGLISLLAVYTVSAWQQENPPYSRLNPGGLLLLWLCPLAWIGYATPIVNAGQVGKLQLALACAVSMVLVLFWVVLTNFLVSIRPGNPVGRSVVLAALLSILAVPLAVSQQSGMALLLIDLATMFEGNRMLVATWGSGLVVTALGITVWAFGRGAGTKRSPKPEL